MSVDSLWRARPERERRAILAGAAAVAAVLVFALVWLPLQRSRARLEAELPQLRASIAALKREADEVKRLKAVPPTVTGNPAPLAALSMQQPLAGAQLNVPDDKHVHMVASDVGFTRLLDWLVTVQSTHGLRVENARIEALAATGRVRADLTLTRS